MEGQAHEFGVGMRAVPCQACALGLPRRGARRRDRSRRREGPACRGAEPSCVAAGRRARPRSSGDETRLARPTLQRRASGHLFGDGSGVINERRCAFARAVALRRPRLCGGARGARATGAAGARAGRGRAAAGGRGAVACARLQAAGPAAPRSCWRRWASRGVIGRAELCP